MTENHPPAAGGGGLADFLEPGTRAIAALVLAVVGLLGPNILASALQVLLGGGMTSGGPAQFYAGLALGTAVPLALAVWLAREPARSTVPGWTTSVARAAVIVSLVGLVGAALLLVAALV